MKKFPSLSSKEAQEVHIKVYQNAARLRKDASMLIDAHTTYATATSLTILSLEEIIKAIVLLLHGQGYQIYRFKGIKKVFSQHGFRHKIAILINMLVGFFKMTQPKKKLNMKRDTKFQKLMYSFFRALQEVPNIMDVFKNIHSIEKLDSYKNAGFYVDFLDEILIPTEVIDKHKYDKVMNIHNQLDKLYNQLVDFFEYEPKTDMERKQKKRKEQQLKTLMNEALVEVDLQELK